MFRRLRIAPTVIAVTLVSLAMPGASASVPASPVRSVRAEGLALAPWSSVDAGDYASCGIRVDGTLWCWGENSWGELGLGDRRPRSKPTQVGDVTTWTSVSIGPSHTCAIQSDQSLWCWGSGRYGEIGIGQRSAGPIVPTQVTKGGHGGWLEVSTGAHDTCAVDRTHRYWCWGENTDGQFGDGASGGHRTRPYLVGDDPVWASVSASGYDVHTCGTKLDGRLFCWGNNHNGQLGVGSTRRHTRPVQVGADSSWAGVAVGGPYSCAAKTDNTLWCWGSASAGELGTGDDQDQLVPAQVDPAVPWASVSVGFDHTCATGTNGSLWCWGQNADGELGDGTTVSRPLPVQVAGHGWRAVSAGAAHSCAVQMDDTLWCWGSDGADPTSTVPIGIP